MVDKEKRIYVIAALVLSGAFIAQSVNEEYWEDKISEPYKNAVDSNYILCLHVRNIEEKLDIASPIDCEELFPVVNRKFNGCIREEREVVCENERLSSQ